MTESPMHSIRLRGPWTAEWEGEAIEFSWPWVDAPQSGSVVLGRFFQQPSNLEGCRVDLVLKGANAQVEINGVELGSDVRRCEISAYLEARNRLTLHVGLPLQLAEVRLEIAELVTDTAIRE